MIRNYESENQILSQIYKWEAILVEKEFFNELLECKAKVEWIKDIMDNKQHNNSYTISN